MSVDLYTYIDQWLAQEPWREAAIRWLGEHNVVAYLVGGTVRDALLGVEGRDLDLAIDGDTLAVGRNLADHLGGAFVPLDVDRDVCRVVIRTASGYGQDHIDLAGLRGVDIVADLCARDLTVNAMALQVSPSHREILDPTGGRADLDACLLRVTGPDAFADDPLRMLRVARMRGKLAFEVETSTLAMMAERRDSLGDVSPERVRDELFLMLDQGDAAGAIAFASDCHLWDACLPFVIDDEGLARLTTLERWLMLLDDPSAVGQAPEPLLSHRQGLLAHWAEELSGGRSRRTLLKLAAMGYASGPEAMRRLGRHLCLSAAEVRSLVGAATGLTVDSPTPLSVYHHYRKLGAAGVDAAVLAMVAAPRDAMTLRKAEHLLDGWFHHHDEWVDPPRLVTGRDAMEVAGLDPGPIVGETLERLREAQVRGDITTRQEALAWLETQRERPVDSELY